MSTILDTCPARMPHETLSAWLDGELDAATTRRVQAHITSCVACQRYLAELRRGDRAVRQHHADAMQDQIWQQLTQKMQRQTRQAKPRSTGIILGGMGAALAVILLFVGVLSLAPGKPGKHSTTISQIKPTATTIPPTALPTGVATAPPGKWTAVPGLAFAEKVAFAPGDSQMG